MSSRNIILIVLMDALVNSTLMAFIAADVLFKPVKFPSQNAVQFSLYLLNASRHSLQISLL